ncbi:hypothetical protein J6590_009768 [Homalodisca vitripennis]|nr:hypothetical protein J6590_009768 [Homalodisca vitripennis]
MRSFSSWPTDTEAFYCNALTARADLAPILIPFLDATEQQPQLHRFYPELQT